MWFGICLILNVLLFAKISFTVGTTHSYTYSQSKTKGLFFSLRVIISTTNSHLGVSICASYLVYFLIIYIDCSYWDHLCSRTTDLPWLRFSVLPGTLKWKIHNNTLPFIRSLYRYNAPSILINFINYDIDRTQTCYLNKFNLRRFLQVPFF